MIHSLSKQLTGGVCTVVHGILDGRGSANTFNRQIRAPRLADGRQDYGSAWAPAPGDQLPTAKHL